MGPAGPMGPAGGFTTVTLRTANFVNSDQIGTVSCMAGEIAFAGGVAVTGPPKNLHTSGPIGMPPTGWMAGYGQKADFQVYAICVH
jgi:hypothetical protein